MSSYLQIIQNNPQDIIPTILLNTQQNKYIFNVSESFHRLHRQHNVKPQQGMRFFMTSLDQPGLHAYLTYLHAQGLSQDCLIYGPQNTAQLFQGLKTKYYIKLLNYGIMNINDSEQYLLGTKEIAYEFYQKKGFHEAYFDNIINSNIFIQNNSFQVNNPLKYINKERAFEEENLIIYPIQIDQQFLSYLIHFKPKPPKISKEKLKQFNIKPQLIKKLQQDKQIYVEELNKLITLEDIIEDKVSEEENTLIVHLQTIQQLNNIQQNEIFNQKINKIANVIHIISKELAKSQEFKDFLQLFTENTFHIFISELFESQTKLYLEEFEHIKLNNKLNEKFNQYFPKIWKQDQEENEEEKIDNIYEFVKYKTVPKTNYQLCLNSQKQNEEKYIPFNKNQQKVINNNQIQDQLITQKDKDEILLLAEQMKQKTQFYDPFICFLGTTCMTPTTLRNNSAILIRDKQTAILLDCGEGTLQQMQNQYGTNLCEEILLQLQILYITHNHSDHYMGFFEVVKKREDIINSKKQEIPPPTLFLFLPISLSQFVNTLTQYVQQFQYCQIIYIENYINISIQDIQRQYLEEDENKGLVRTQQLQKQLNENCQYFSQQQNVISNFEKVLENTFNFAIFKPVEVIHCPQSYGLIIQHKSGIKISYSGDTIPCEKFAKEIGDSDLLIHEGTFNSDLIDHAIKARHSTVCQAIQISKNANRKALAVTHVSNRHSKLDIDENDLYQKYNTLCAFDHMEFQLSSFYDAAQASKKLI